MTKHFVATLEDLQASGKILVTVDGIELGAFYVEQGVHIYRSVCPHRGVSVCKGLVGGTNLPSNVYEYHYDREQQILRCPLHAWEFDLLTGQLLLDPLVKLKKYEAVIEENSVYAVI
ncbi:Rieske 2Fe-2S domain-containing protein [Paenibacillus sp. LMG 31456]|uniref:Rieske 2Fe-2S domain-containing protein n=1 Tax=Paenibacillus foliorum TaxID=2654974 RepID=A0A972K229_9BACL|nr:Rieske 2Fe-2S domain-containing protein [Paenibacillus foliorum]NOU94508.1 Rieske 2Fe-2S domain-containing protein [Paenibacillus foliorum]